VQLLNAIIDGDIEFVTKLSHDGVDMDSIIDKVCGSRIFSIS